MRQSDSSKSNINDQPPSGVSSLQKGNIVNSTQYNDILEELKARLRQVKPEKTTSIQHGNARTRTSRETQAALDWLDS